MAYDEDLAERIRELVGGERKPTEQKMFGGLAFLIRGNTAIAASGQGGLLVRVDTEHVRTKRQLTNWVELGTSEALGLLGWNLRRIVGET